MRVFLYYNILSMLLGNCSFFSAQFEFLFAYQSSFLCRLKCAPQIETLYSQNTATIVSEKEFVEVSVPV